MIRNKIIIGCIKVVNYIKYRNQGNILYVTLYNMYSHVGFKIWKNAMHLQVTILCMEHIYDAVRLPLSFAQIIYVKYTCICIPVFLIPTKTQAGKLIITVSTFQIPGKLCTFYPFKKKSRKRVNCISWVKYYTVSRK